MKTIISKIIEESNLGTISLDKNVDFAYYNNEKDDFFLFLFYNQEDLIELNNNEVVDLEYTINRIIVDLKMMKIFLSLKKEILIITYLLFFY